jgi:pSer/pThr/pTyr-binding forkhead associated (FHA) protein
LVLILHFMGGSAPQAPTPPGNRPEPSLRASDADRDQVVGRLRDEYVAGRLSHDTFLHRVDSVLGSKRQAELPAMLEDLPDLPEPQGRLLGRWVRSAWAKVTGTPTGGYQTVRPSAPSTPPARAVTTHMRAAPGRGQPLALQFPRGHGSQFSIGRDSSCDLAIADMTVSRRHAQLERTADGWLLSDLESTNGTRVNGWRVRGKVPVKPGDLVSFGDLETVLLRTDDDQAPRTRREGEPPAPARDGGFAPS